MKGNISAFRSNSILNHPNITELKGVNFTAVYFLLGLNSIFYHLKANVVFLPLVILFLCSSLCIRKKACCLLCTTFLGVCAVRENLFCNFKSETETPDFVYDLSAISFSHMDTVCPIEPYTRA